MKREEEWGAEGEGENEGGETARARRNGGHRFQRAHIFLRPTATKDFFPLSQFRFLF
jgi:hypothetical protein